MKRIVFFIVGLLLPVLGFSQQIPMYSQYIWNAYLINPAIGGAENFLEVKAGYRSQWVGLEGAPQTLFITANTQLGKKVLNREDKDVVNRESNGNDQEPSGLARFFRYTKPAYPNLPQSYKVRAHHGVGFQILGDRIGPFTNMGFYGNYAYHVPITSKMYASLGTFLGLKQYKMDIGRVMLENPDDMAIGNQGNLYGLFPDAMVGFMLYSEKFYAGISANQILYSNVSLRNRAQQYVSATAKLEPHYFLTGGYRIGLSSEFAFIPSTLVRYYPGTKLSADFTGKINYMDLLWAGVSYRAAEALVFLVGFSYANKLDFGYSYDLSVSQRNKYVRLVSHEIMVGFRMINNKSIGRPSYVW